MGHQKITIALPEKVYQKIEQLSQIKNSSIAEELVSLIAAALPEETGELSTSLEPTLQDLEHLSEADLRRAAKMTAPPEKTNRMQLLLQKQQLTDLTQMESEEMELLSRFFNRIMLVRAKATVLLQARGQDISQLAKD